jgi:hypothetical protein
MVGPLGGAGRRSGSGHHQSWRRRWRAAWGVLAAGLAAATTEVEDVDGGAPGGCWRQGAAVPTTKVEDVDDGPPGGARARDPGAQRVRSLSLGRTVNDYRNLGQMLKE